MTDPHLNLFYTYNQDNQLIENNLTRAFIITTRFLSEPSRDILWNSLIAERVGSTLIGNSLKSISLENAEFALQDNMDRDISRSSLNKFIVSISSYRYEVPDDIQVTIYTSKPDGWIYDQSGTYCFLVESKIGDNPISNPQIISHALKWLEIPQTKLTEHLISLTWNDVVGGVQNLLISTISSESPGLSYQERSLLNDFKDYMKLYGYGKYSGLSFDGLVNAPSLHIMEQEKSIDYRLTLNGLADSPKLLLNIR